MATDNHEADRGASEERRIDTPVFKKAIELASRFQMEQVRPEDDKLTETEIVSIGSRLGIDPTNMQRALEQAETGTSKKRIRFKKPGLRNLFRPVIDHKGFNFFLPFGLAMAWGFLAWFTGRALFFTLYSGVPLAVFLGFLTGSRKTGALAVRLLVFCLSVSFWSNWTIPYFCMGLLLSGWLAKTGVELREEHFPIQRDEDEGTGEVSRQTLLQALMILQTELDKHKQRRAFLSVDVVGSTEMVTSSPEYEVEYTFKLFRAWVEFIVKEHGGEIHSAAGDGMMCRFDDDLGAVRAARKIQQELPRFNAAQNRLPMPFRLRCGISAGDVAAEAGAPLGELQSPAVYRAATLQKQAEPGGIVVGEEVTEAARSELGPLALIPPAPETGRAYASRRSTQTTEG